MPIGVLAPAVKKVCPQCGKALEKVYPRWDEFMTPWFVAELVAFVLIIISLAMGPYWYFYAAAPTVLLLWVEMRRPKKYFCRSCNQHVFIPTPRAA